MNEIKLQVVGVDMASKKFDVCFKEQSIKGRIIIKGAKSFDNDLEGFKKYRLWCAKRKKDCPLIHLMEATGVYHENLCYFLNSYQEQVSIQLPQKAKHFIKSLNIKTKTDKTDAASLADMGFSRKLDLWRPISKDFKNIRDLSRTLSRLNHTRTVTKTQLHAMECAHDTLDQARMIMQELVDKQDELIAACQREILELVQKDQLLRKRIDKITQIKGIGIVTVVKLLAETDGFRNTKSIRSLVSYAGLDVVHNQSGTKTGRTRISKKGNSHIRAALYMPALSACRHDWKSKKTYQRLLERLPRKRQAVVAVMRKLLIMVYTLWKNGEDYNPNHQWEKKRRSLSPVAG
jgi:transposase